MIKSWLQTKIFFEDKMIILNKPYVSDYLIQTIKENNLSVLENEIAKQYNLKTTDNKTAIEKYINENELFYTNSENSIDWIMNNLADSHLAKMIKISKDKLIFRRAIQKIYPDFYFREISLEEIQTINPIELKFPFIIKPSVGFLSFGVYPIKNEMEWESFTKKIQVDIENLKNIFPKEVVDMNNFIIEDVINGEEYALDAYFNENGEAIILNIFNHPFFNDKDVSDRAYFTSKEIIEKYLNKFKKTLDEIGKITGFKNFPFHLELRVDEEKIIPIEINPMRFCGWCITDIAQHAWNINVYEYFFKQLKPDWSEILKNSTDEIFYFTIGDIPSNIDRKNIKKIDFEKYLKNISNPLEIRKIDYIQNPIFAITFAKTKDINEIKNILKLDMSNFIEL